LILSCHVSTVKLKTNKSKANKQQTKMKRHNSFILAIILLVIVILVVVNCDNRETIRTNNRILEQQQQRMRTEQLSVDEELRKTDAAMAAVEDVLNVLKQLTDKQMADGVTNKRRKNSNYRYH
jgi:hypothetical protein